MDKGYFIPTDRMVQKLLFDYCTTTLNCVGLADGYECTEQCPVHRVKGYRKIEGEPPLLSDEEMLPVIWDMGVRLEGEGKEATQIDRFQAIAKAQRDLMIKWYKGRDG